MGRFFPDPKPAGGPLPKGNPGRRPPAPRPHRSSGSSNPPKSRREKDKGCPMVAAVRSARAGKFQLAARYARWSVTLIGARIV